MRMTCLKRWGEGFEGRPYQKNAEDIVMKGEYYEKRAIDSDEYVLCWPIPSYDLKLNKNLVQNDGYEQ